MALSQRLQIPAEPGARDDAAADAGHQAAAALQSRSRRPMSKPNSSAIRCWTARADGEPAAVEPERAEATPMTVPPRRRLERARTSRPAARAIEDALDTRLENVFPDDAASRRSARRRAEPAAYSEWAASAPAAARTATTISKPSSPPRRRSRIVCAEQLALAVADPARRMIGQYLIDLVDEAGYLSGDLAAVAEKLGAPHDRNRSGARHPAELRSARRVRAQSRRMPRHPAQGARPLRSGDGGAGRASRSAGQARFRRARRRSAASATRTSPT